MHHLNAPKYISQWKQYLSDDRTLPDCVLFKKWDKSDLI